MAKKAPARQPDRNAAKRTYLSQGDVPSMGVEQALKVARALADNFGKQPARPLQMAQALGIQPTSGGFRTICGASIAYGLTDGGYNSDQISLTPLGRRIVAPTKEGDDVAARREAFLRPRVVRDFLSRYDGSRVPSEAIGRNVLEDLNVPQERTQQVFGFIVEGAREVGFLRDVKGQLYVDLSGTPTGAEDAPPIDSADGLGEPQDEPAPSAPSTRPLAPIGGARPPSRVFITHGRNTDIVAQLKDLLTFGNFVPVVALENETVAKSISDKVMDDMRSCAAAIIHVGSESRYMDDAGKEHKLLNQNVLIEIGAAMALYGRKFILLVEQGATLPSNLQGLYEVRYTGTKLDYEATMKLLKAFNDFRS
jgi:hypothetical protein